MPLSRRDARARGIRSTRRGSIAVVFRRELFTRRHFVPGPTSPTAILRSTSPFSNSRGFQSSRGARRLLASPQTAAVPPSPSPSSSSSCLPIFLSPSTRARGVRSGKKMICQQFVFFVHACMHSAPPDVTRFRARDNNINRLRNRAQAEERFFPSLSLPFFPLSLPRAAPRDCAPRSSPAACPVTLSPLPPCSPPTSAASRVIDFSYLLLAANVNRADVNRVASRPVTGSSMKTS